MEFNTLLEKAGSYLSPEKLDLLKDAYSFSLKAHQGQLRKTGEPFVEHPLQVALTLAELQMDSSSLAAALLHDVSEDTDISIEKIKKKFGGEVAKLVDGATKLEELALKVPAGVPRDSLVNRQQAENLRKMLVAMAEDLRVVFIKLADRLHNMRTLEAFSPA